MSTIAVVVLAIMAIDLAYTLWEIEPELRKPVLVSHLFVYVLIIVFGLAGLLAYSRLRYGAFF